MAPAGSALPRSNIDAAIDDAIATFQFDPDRWARFAFDWGQGELASYDGPRAWQTDINNIIRDHLADPDTRYQPLQIAVASGHGIGKSAEMGMLSNWALSCFDDARIVTTANTGDQLRTKTAPEIGKWARLSITSDWWDVQATTIKARDPLHSESWRQDFITWSQHNTEAFAGLHNKDKIIVLMFDEASKIHDKVWEVAEGALTDENTIIIWIVFGNPTRNSGRFRECFRRFRHRWITRQIDSRTVPGTNKAFLDKFVADHGEDSDKVKIRVRGQFPSTSAKQLLSGEDVEAARSRFLRPEQYNWAPKILGVDPAWTGDDSLEIMLRQGLYSRSILTLPKNDNDIWVAQKIAALEDELQIDQVFIDFGYGTGIISAGRTMGRTWIGVWFSSKSTDEGFLNKRAQMWGSNTLGIKGWLKDGGVIDPHDEELYQDLIGPETVARTDGKVQLESKEDMKARELPSPNKGDALSLTFAQPVAHKDRRTIVGQVNHHAVEVDYDPLA
jgi:hypothetical protein